MEKDKTKRVLGIYTKLINGEFINKYQEANDYGVNEKSIQRDIEDIRDFLESEGDRTGSLNTIIYDKKENAYHLETNITTKLTNSEILGICKILLDSRAFTKKEMNVILEKLVDCCVPQENQKIVRGLLLNEAFHYIEPRHKTVFLDKLWDIGQAIQQCRYIEIDYMRTCDKKVVTRKVKPVAIMFSEYYFYLTAFIDDENVRRNFDVIEDSFPTIYRIDRIKKLNILEEHFRIPYSSRFEEGEFRKRVQFMYAGELYKFQFRYTGRNKEAVFDRLPTAELISEDETGSVFEAELYGRGVMMWLLSQGRNIEVLGPESFREKMKQEIREMLRRYEAE